MPGSKKLFYKWTNADIAKISQTECILLIADKAKLGISGLDESVKYLLLLSTYDGLVDYVTLVH